MKSKLIENNIAYAISVIKESVNEDGQLPNVGSSFSANELVDVISKMAMNPNRSFADLAKSPKMGMALNKFIIQGVKLFEAIETRATAEKKEPSEFEKELEQYMNEIGFSFDESVPSQPKETDSFIHCISMKEHSERIINALREVLNGKRGRKAALIFTCAIELGLINRPSYLAAKAEFGDIGGRSNFNKYMYGGFTTQEKQPGKMALKQLLGDIIE